ncbi:MAG: FAD-binding oxidoreductase, partial [Sulfurimonas sp.]|nr:FAD-binding oxidoreductase [Sulfurimonas sp.]
MYPKIKNQKFTLRDTKTLTDYIDDTYEFIPFGNGRSYGDSAINENILYCKNYNNFLDFDETTGVLTCQAGVLLSEILDAFVKRGWFLKVTPGTKLITVGGAIASDV